MIFWEEEFFVLLTFTSFFSSSLLFFGEDTFWKSSLWFSSSLKCQDVLCRAKRRERVESVWLFSWVCSPWRLFRASISSASTRWISIVSWDFEIGDQLVHFYQSLWTWSAKSFSRYTNCRSNCRYERLTLSSSFLSFWVFFFFKIKILYLTNLNT